MSLFPSRTRPFIPSAPSDVLARVRHLWQAHLHRKAARDSLERLLARSDDHLLNDVGISRVTAHRLLGETLVVPHRAWDRWQG